MVSQENHPMMDSANPCQNDPAKVARARQRQEDHAWAMAHYNELDQQYHGECVVIWKKRVIAHGVDLGELLRQTETPERPAEELVIVDFPAFFETPH
jgi:Family of unknown function (DUF5678)